MEVPKSPNVSKSFGFAFEGIKLALKYNRNLRIHFVVAVVVLFLGYLLRISLFEVGIVSVMIVLVICTEMINTVIEEMVDLIIKEHREEARIAKDVAAGMVLVAAVGAFFVGILVFVPHLLPLFNP